MIIYVYHILYKKSRIKEKPAKALFCSSQVVLFVGLLVKATKRFCCFWLTLFQFAHGHLQMNEGRKD